MVSLAIICEGKTERMFANQLLAPHCASFGIEIDPIEIGVECKQPGGNVSDFVTTLIDFFRLGAGWSGKGLIKPGMSSSEQAETVEAAALQDARNRLPDLDVDNRFIPNVLMHEFEGLLFTAPEAIVEITRAHAALGALVQVMGSFQSPEDINTGEATAPSKRLANLGANYGKIAHGARIAERIGLPEIRSKCHHFNDWLVKLETLGGRYAQ